MKPLKSKPLAVAGAVLYSCIYPLAAQTVNEPEQAPETAPALKNSQTASGQKDEANSSPRERGRILVKLNPIASEYQVFGDIGTSPGADADGEGVDFRAFFPKNNPVDKPIDSLAVGYTFNYNDQSSIGKSGYNLSFTKRLNPEGSLVLSAQTRTSISDRNIEHYGSVWQLPKESDPDNPVWLQVPGEATYVLDRARFSFDEIYTKNVVSAAQLGFQANERNKLYFKTYYQDYADNFYRNRLELQFGAASPVEGSQTIAPDGSITSASLEGAATRRYFGDTDSFRTRQHNSFGGTYSGDEWTIDYSVYLQKWNLDSLWRDWNFRDRNLELSYSIDDPYLPTITENGDTDLLDVSGAISDLIRIHNSYTRDRDQAARVDAERSISLGDREIWIQTGLLHREKKRETWQEREVLSTNTPLTLSELAFDTAGTPLLDGSYTQPAGLDPLQGRAFLETNAAQFTHDLYRERTESAPESYTTEESVTSAYLLGTREVGEWKFELGGRIERTQTSTRGTVVIPEAVNDPSEGEFIETITNPNNGQNFIIKNLYSENSYNNFIPSGEVLFKPSNKNSFKAAWFQLLMRPQYFNIVDYRRISTSTRTISEGNPNLAPSEIDKFRLSWTREEKRLGTFSLEAYMISIENFFYGSVAEESLLEGGVPVPYRVSRVENGEKASIKGFEVQWEKSAEDFTIFDKASTELAYTYSDSEATVQSRPGDALPTPERSRHLLKFSLSGTLGKLTNGIDFTYQSSALDDLGSSYDQDEYREAVVGLSWSSKYRLNEKTTISLNVSNLTDHPERSYEGSPLRVSLNQYSSWFGSFDFSRSF